MLLISVLLFLLDSFYGLRYFLNLVVIIIFVVLGVVDYYWLVIKKFIIGLFSLILLVLFSEL